MTYASTFSGCGGARLWYTDTEMRKLSDETRRRMSESAKARCKRGLPKAAFVWVPFCTRDELVFYYEASHMSQDEIAVKLGVTRKRVWRAMINYDIPRRPQVKRDQRGEKNSSWKGDLVNYKSAHSRVNRCRGKARLHPCSRCGTSDKSKWYDWANLTGDFPNVNDYAPMCRSCHRQFDKSKKEVSA